MIDANIECPLCKEKESEALYKLDVSEVLSNLQVTEPLRKIELTEEVSKIWNKTYCTFNKCKVCGFNYSDPFKSASPKFYSLLYKETSYYPDWKWDFEVTKNSVVELLKAREIKSTDRLLEIGAGKGAFLKEMVCLFKKENIYSTEYSEYGRNEIEKLSVRCDSINLHEIDTSHADKRFHIIFMFQVLEHLDNIDDVFVKINQLAQEGAHLFIMVPNPNYRELCDSVDYYLDIPPVHISRWKKEAMQKAASLYGWEVVAKTVEPKSLFSLVRKFLYNYYFNKFVASKRIEKISNDSLQRLLRLGSILFISIKYFPTLLKFFKIGYGVSQWVHLKRN